MGGLATGALRAAVVTAAAASLAACATPRYSTSGPPSGPVATQKVGQPYQVNGVWYVPREQPNYDEVGLASWYGDAFHLKTTANMEIFDKNLVSAAHTTLPLPCMVEVTNLENGRRLLVRVNDRGPFVPGRIIDLSQEGARQLGFERQGVTRVRVRYAGPAPLVGPDAGVRYASTRPAPRAAVAAPAATLQLASAASPPYARRSPSPASSPRPRITGAATPAQYAPLTGEALASPAPRPAAPAVQPAPQPSLSEPEMADASPAPSAAYVIQAGSFSAEANAQRAAAQLADLGEVEIEPTERGGVTLYRVLVSAPADEAEAYGLRDRVAGVGFEDARVIRLF